VDTFISLHFTVFRLVLPGQWAAKVPCDAALLPSFFGLSWKAIMGIVRSPRALEPLSLSSGLLLLFPKYQLAK
jgi:hypothetical protein